MSELNLNNDNNSGIFRPTSSSNNDNKPSISIPIFLAPLEKKNGLKYRKDLQILLGLFILILIFIIYLIYIYYVK